MNKKTKRKARRPPVPKYVCRWCNTEKPANNYFKCSIDHGAFICKECAENKYNQLNNITEKQTAILIMAHHLNIAYSFDVFKTLGIGEGIGHYIRTLNLVQNKAPDTFEESILKDNIFSFIPPDFRIDEAKSKIQNVMDILQGATNTLKDVKYDL